MKSYIKILGCAMTLSLFILPGVAVAKAAVDNNRVSTLKQSVQAHKNILQNYQQEARRCRQRCRRVCVRGGPGGCWRWKMRCRRVCRGGWVGGGYWGGSWKRDPYWSRGYSGRRGGISIN